MATVIGLGILTYFVTTGLEKISWLLSKETCNKCGSRKINLKTDKPRCVRHN